MAIVVAFADYVTGPELSFSIFYFAPIVFTAWFANRRDVALISLICAGFWLAADLLAHHSYSHALVPVWNSSIRLGIFVIVGFTFFYLKQKSARELEMASEIQRAFMPRGTPDFHGYEISFVYTPLGEVSGDYFDVFTSDSDNLGLCIADASGHGMAAALIVANIQSAVRIFANQKLSPEEICRRSNELLDAMGESGNFLSFFYATIDHRTRRLTYSNAGHEPPILLRHDGSYERLETGGPPLGVKADATYEQRGLSVQPGSRLLLYTDGVVELRNRRDEEFGFDRLLKTVLKSHDASVSALQKSVLDELSAFKKGAFQDDVTLAVISIA